MTVVLGAGLAQVLLHVSVTKCPLRKNVWGRGGLRGGSTYLKRERLGLGLESLLYPSRLGLG